MNLKVIKELFKTQPKTFILIFALLVADVGLYMYAAGVQRPRVEKLQVAWFEKRKSTGGGAALDAAAIYRQGENDLKTWRTRITPKKVFASLVGRVLETANNNSLAFKGVSYSPKFLKEENLISYGLDLNVSGKYAAVKSFVFDLERMPEIMTIDNISLNTSKATEDAVALKVGLTIYLRTEEQ